MRGRRDGRAGRLAPRACLRGALAGALGARRRGYASPTAGAPAACGRLGRAASQASMHSGQVGAGRGPLAGAAGRAPLKAVAPFAVHSAGQAPGYATRSSPPAARAGAGARKARSCSPRARRPGGDTAMRGVPGVRARAAHCFRRAAASSAVKPFSKLVPSFLRIASASDHECHGIACSSGFPSAILAARRPVAGSPVTPGKP